MPKIATYNAPEGLGLRPTETGINAVAAAARRVQGEYNEAAAAIEGTGQRINSTIREAGSVATAYADHQQISHGANALANLVAAKTKQWNDVAKTADPNDPTVGPRFLEGNLEPDLEKFKSAFMTERSQQWAETHVDQFRQHMFAKTSADMADAAGHAQKINFRQTTNGLSNTVRSDPSSLDFSLRTLDSSVGAMVDSSPNLTGVAATKIKNELLQHGREEIVKSAAMGYIEKTGEVPPWASDSKYAPFINGAELKQFQTYAKSQQRANQLTEKQLLQYGKQQQADAAHKELGQNWTDNVSFDENGKATIKPDYFKNVMEIEKRYSGAATERAKAMINFGQAQQRERRETIITNKAAQSSLMEGLFRTNNPTTDVDILKAAAAGDLDPHATSTLMQLHKALEEAPLKGPIWQSTMQGAKEIVGADTVPDGHERYANFMQSFIPEYLRQQRAGTLAPNALDLRNKDSLISRALDKFRATTQEKMMGRILKGLGGAIPEGGLDIGAVRPPPSKTAIPPVADREDGKIYVTPNGTRIWDKANNGWRKP